MKNKANSHSKNKKNNEKSAFKVDPGRAQKAKKGKAFVKFNKAKTQSMNRDLISKLDFQLTPLQMTVRNGTENNNETVDEKFINPVRESIEENIRLEEDINNTIQQLADAF